jgi:hypothetical protein
MSETDREMPITDRKIWKSIFLLVHRQENTARNRVTEKYGGHNSLSVRLFFVGTSSTGRLVVRSGIIILSFEVDRKMRCTDRELVFLTTINRQKNNYLPNRKITGFFRRNWTDKKTIFPLTCN